MPLTGQELHALIARRKEREALVRQEARTGESLPPMLELMRAEATSHIGEPGWPTQAEIDAEIDRSRARRAGR